MMCDLDFDRLRCRRIQLRALGVVHASPRSSLVICSRQHGWTHLKILFRIDFPHPMLCKDSNPFIRASLSSIATSADRLITY